MDLSLLWITRFVFGGNSSGAQKQNIGNAVDTVQGVSATFRSRLDVRHGVPQTVTRPMMRQGLTLGAVEGNDVDASQGHQLVLHSMAGLNALSHTV